MERITSNFNLGLIAESEKFIPAIHGQTPSDDVNGSADLTNSAESSGFRTIPPEANALPESVIPTAKEPNHANLEAQTIAEPAKVTAESPGARSRNKKKSEPKKKTAKSSGIASLTDGLAEEQKAAVDRLLKEIPEAFKDYSTRRRKLGEHLSELQEVFAKAGKNGRLQKCLNHLHIPKSTAYDLIGRHKRIIDLDLPDVILQAAEAVGIDLGAPELYSRVEDLRFSREGLDLAKAKEIIEPLTKKAKRAVTQKFGPGITEEEKKVFKVFDALRRSMADFAGKEKEKVLAKALDLYAHYYLQHKEPMSLEMIPTRAEDDWVLLPSQGKAAKEVTCQ